MEAMADTIPYTAVGSKASELCKAMIRELLMGQSVEGYCGNCNVIRNAEVPKYEVRLSLTLPLSHTTFVLCLRGPSGYDCVRWFTTNKSD